MKLRFVVLALAATAAVLWLSGAAQAGACGSYHRVRVLVGPTYSYDGYQPPPFYYRAYYGDYRPPRVYVCRHHWRHRHAQRSHRVAGRWRG